MCQPHLNTLKQVSETQDAPFQAQAIHTTYQATILHYWNKIQPFLHEETAISHGHHKWHSFQFLPPEKLWQMSPIIKSFP